MGVLINLPALHIIVFIVGVVFLLIGLLGGIDSPHIRISPLSRVIRFIMALIGVAFIAGGIILSKPDGANKAEADDLAKSTSSVAGGKYGAIAVSESERRYGYGMDYSTREEAEKWALYDCKAKDARILLSFQNACGAFASGKNHGIGTAQASTKAEAERLALAQCAEKDKDCVVKYAGCTSH